MKKSKQELVEEAAKIALKHQSKKEVIEKIFSDLDKEDKTTVKHIDGIAAVNELLKDLEILENEHFKILEQIKIS